MPSLSKAQQRFFGVVKAMQKGDKSKEGEAGKVAKSMKKKDVDDFASTKHKGLPNKVKKEMKVRQLIKKMVREELKKLDEKCWKGYEKKGTKKMFGKTYPNCVKKETVDKLNEKLSKMDIKKMRDKFDKTGKLPPHLMKLAKLMDKHSEVRNIVVPGLEWMSKLGEGKLSENKIYSKKDGLKLVKKIQSKDKTVYKVDKHKSTYAGKKVTMYALYTKNKNYYSGNNPHNVDMAKSSGKNMYLVPIKEGRGPCWVGYTQKGMKKKGDRMVPNCVKNEEITESRVAKTILQQLGGNKFIAMTGAKNLGSTNKSLQFKIGRNSKSISHVIITLKSSDLYEMEFIRIRGVKRTVVKKVKGVYADQLQTMFTKYTGMNTRL